MRESDRFQKKPTDFKRIRENVKESGRIWKIGGIQQKNPRKPKEPKKQKQVKEFKKH